MAFCLVWPNADIFFIGSRKIRQILKSAGKRRPQKRYRYAYRNLLGRRRRRTLGLSCLPAFFYAAQLFSGIEDMEEIKKNFKELFNFDMMELSKLDYPTCYHGKLFNFNSSKPIIFNDLFCGIYDDLVFDDLTEFHERYDGYIKELACHENHPEFGYLFKMARSLTELIKLRFDLGVRTRDAYKAGDKEALRKIVDDYTETHRLACVFYDAFREVWYKERKGNGFEVQSARLGGMKQRLFDCRDRLTRTISRAR